MIRFLLWLPFCLVLLTSADAVNAQTATPGKRPKIALVLGGGSALGLSHIGVIQWLEEHRIPVDIVAGTSMGGLVGGLYATGADAAELSQFVKDVDWAEALAFGPSFQSVSYRRKEDRRQYPNQLLFGLEGGIHLPAGFSSGQGVGLVLSRIAARYDELSSFDKLPIPFACVATELVSGDQIIFRSGRLFDALRSTMAIPGVFTPWRIGNQVLVDGGALNNLPVDVAQSMGADFVIAVVLETPPIDEKAVQSVLGVAGRSISVMIANNEKRSLAMADIGIYPELKGFTSADFERGEELRVTGYKAAQTKAAALQRLALSESDWKEHLRQRRSRMIKPVDPKFVEVKVDSPVAQKAFLKELAFVTEDPGFERSRLEKSLATFAGLGRYGSADYRFIRRGNQDGLEVDVRKRLLGSPTLNLLFQLDGSSSEGLRFGLGGRLTFFDLGGPFSEWRTDMNVGAFNNGISSEYYWRVKASRLFLAPYISARAVDVPIRQDHQTLAQLDLDQQTIGGDIGWAHSRKSELRFGYQLAHTRTSLTGSIIELPELKGLYNSLRLRYVYEGQDSPLVPRNGFRFAGQYEWVITAPDDTPGFGVFEGGLGYARPLGGPYSFITTASGGSAPSRAGTYSLFTLGGTARLTALARNQLFGNQYYFANAGVLRALNQKASGLGRYYAGLFYEVGGTKLEGFNGRPYQDGTLGIIGETFIGMVFGGVSVGDKGERKVVFRLGRLF